MKADQIHNRRGSELSTDASSKKKKGIGAVLKGCVTRVSAELMGIETMVNTNIQNFISQISADHNIASEYIFVKFNLVNEHLQIQIYGKGQFIKQATVHELVDFFIGLNTAKLLGIEKKVDKSVIKFIKEYAGEHAVAPKEVAIIIYQKEGLTVVKSYKQTAFLEELPLTHLIKYFRS